MPPHRRSAATPDAGVTIAASRFGPLADEADIEPFGGSAQLGITELQQQQSRVVKARRGPSKEPTAVARRAGHAHSTFVDDAEAKEAGQPPDKVKGLGFNVAEMVGGGTPLGTTAKKNRTWQQ